MNNARRRFSALRRHAGVSVRARSLGHKRGPHRALVVGFRRRHQRILARLLAQRLTETARPDLRVENKPAPPTNIGNADGGSRSPTDTTLLMDELPDAINHNLYEEPETH